MPNFMQEALKLAEKGRYSVNPNPMVGCLIVKDGNIVGRGYHKKAGEPHAEILALAEAGKNAAGADVFVTLEPCAHFGRTPPCVDALIKSKIKSVHIPFVDPNPVVNGKGVQKLLQAGISVFIGEEAKAAQRQNEVFLHYITTQKPYIVAKWAMTLDGRIALDSKKSKWITNVEARKHAHFSRSWLGAVLVGVNTILADNPQLTPHLLDETDNIKPPVRIVLDSCGRSPLNGEVFKQQIKYKTIVATTEKSSLNWRKNLAEKNVTVLLLPQNQYGHVELKHLLTELGKLEISGLLVEGGKGILTNFFQEKLVNRIHAYVAAKVIGGKENFSPLDDLSIFDLTQAQNFIFENCVKVGVDFFLNAALPSNCNYVYGNN